MPQPDDLSHFTERFLIASDVAHSEERLKEVRAQISEHMRRSAANHPWLKRIEALEARVKELEARDAQRRQALSKGSTEA